MNNNFENDLPTQKSDIILLKIEKFFVEACNIFIAICKLVLYLIITWFYYIFRSKKFAEIQNAACYNILNF